MTDYRHTAALVLAKCAAYDPWFPKASAAIVESWAEQLETWKVEQADALAGVTKMYADNGNGFRPLPKDLVDAVRFIRDKRAKDRAADTSRQLSGPPPATAEQRRRAIESFTRSFGESAHV